MNENDQAGRLQWGQNLRCSGLRNQLPRHPLSFCTPLPTEQLLRVVILCARGHPSTSLLVFTLVEGPTGLFVDRSFPPTLHLVASTKEALSGPTHAIGNCMSFKTQLQCYFSKKPPYVLSEIYGRKDE